MKILASGCSGLVGSRLLPALSQAGHSVVQLVRHSPSAANKLMWSPKRGELSAAAFEGIDGVIHLGGESIATGRWSTAKKQRIRESRLVSTRLLAETMASASPPPKFFICASAIGFYGNRGDEVLTEESNPGNDFLANLCIDWEATADLAREAGVRVVHSRFGIVLSKKGGALQKMLTPFRLGLGGIVGNGRQYYSSVALDELVRMLIFCAENESISGPVNIVSPSAVTNRVFTKTLGKVLKRPTIFPLPAVVAKLLLGEMAGPLLLSSARVDPARLRESGYSFEFADLESGLRHELAK